MDPVGPAGTVRLRTSRDRRAATTPTSWSGGRGCATLEGQARILLNDLAEYRAWLEWYERRPIDADEAADRWLREVYRPTLARIAAFVGPDRDLVQAYCDVLEHKWLLSERAGRDVGLDAAIESYVAEGAPAPEQPAGATASAEQAAWTRSTWRPTTSTWTARSADGGGRRAGAVRRVSARPSAPGTGPRPAAGGRPGAAAP